MCDLFNREKCWPVTPTACMSTVKTKVITGDFSGYLRNHMYKAPVC